MVWFLVFLFSLGCLASGEKLPVDRVEFANQMDNLLEGYDFYGRISGTLLLADEDGVIYQNSFGYRDFEGQLPNTNGSIFGIGSISKSFSSAAIMKLVEEGKLDLDDTVSMFFPALGEKAGQITIHNLLRMSSGIHEDIGRSKTYDIDDVVFPESWEIDLDSLIHYFGELSLDFDPGQEYDYSNINYIILGGIIEKISGKSYLEYLRESFWEPLGMNSTGFGRENFEDPLLAKPYVGLPLEHKTPDFWDSSWYLGAGGIFSSAQDLYTWMQSLKNNQVLSSTSTEEIFKKQQGAYGYGWQIESRLGYDYFNHIGGDLGYVGEAGFFPELGIYVVLLTNHSHELLELDRTVRLNEEILNKSQNSLLGNPVSFLPVPREQAEIEIGELASLGGYEFSFQQKEGEVSVAATQDDISLMDVFFRQQKTEDSRRFDMVNDIAQAYGNEDFGFIRRNSVLMIRVIVSESRLESTWKEITGETGGFVSYNIYSIPGEETDSAYFYRIRLVYEKKEVGLILNLTSRGRIQGMHIDRNFSFGGPLTIEATIIDHNTLFVDGFRYGYPDAYIINEGEGWVFRTRLGEIAIEN